MNIVLFVSSVMLFIHIITFILDNVEDTIKKIGIRGTIHRIIYSTEMKNSILEPTITIFVKGKKYLDTHYKTAKIKIIPTILIKDTNENYYSYKDLKNEMKIEIEMVNSIINFNTPDNEIYEVTAEAKSIKIL